MQRTGIHIAMESGLPALSMRFLPLLSPIWRKPFLSLPKRSISHATCSSISPNQNKPRVIVISGPTGSGKSRLALELAKRLDGEIISADSVQVYRGLDVGSAKPSTTDRKEVAHHLLDTLHPSEEYSAGQFFEDARKATQSVLENGRVPIVAGGTGLYLRWYIYGKPDVPKASTEIASEVCSEMMEFQRSGQWDAAVNFVVQAGDPKARLVPYNDWYRLRRSLEIIRSTGSPPSAFPVPYESFREQAAQGVSESDGGSSPAGIAAENLDYDFICLFLSSPRVDLYRSIDLRCEEMLMDTEGLLSEASRLLDIGLRPNVNSATRAIGYRQAMDYLLCCREEGGRTCPESFGAFLSDFQKASRNFAKRQMTWFRNELIYHWLDASQPLQNVVDFIHGAYCNRREKLVVPDSLKMRKDVTDRRENYELKSYRTRNRLFLKHEDCNHILNWIQRTQNGNILTSE